MTFAYADPPYIGQARKHYSQDPACAEVDHVELIGRLYEQYPDGWALSCSSPTLSEILAICRNLDWHYDSKTSVRIMAWVKPFCAFKVNVNPAYAWEPVIVRGGRRRTRKQETTRDWISASITLKKGLHGAKPKEFCYWLFDVLNIEHGDTLDDLFPGTGIVSDCFRRYVGERSALDGTPMFSAFKEPRHAE